VTKINCGWALSLRNGLMMTERRWVQSADASTTKQIRRSRLKRRRRRVV